MRCKACNELLIVSWRKRVQRWEDLCLTCRLQVNQSPTKEEMQEHGFEEVNCEFEDRR
jgi:hypothetical protein